MDNRFYPTPATTTTTAPTDQVNLRVRVTRSQHRSLRRLGVDSERTVQDLLQEAVLLLLRYYTAQEFEAAQRREEACDD